MIAWVRHHSQSAGDAVRRLGRAPFATFVAMLMIGTALALPLAGFVGLQNLRTLGARLAGVPQMTVFLALDANRADVERVGALLRNAPGAARVSFVPRDDALAGLRKRADLGEALTVLRANPLPDAFVIDLAGRAPADAERIATLARADGKVAHVQLDAAWLRRLDAILRLGTLLVGWLGALLAIGLAAVSFGVIRTEIAARQDEIAVARIVGATEAYVRRPLLYTGALLGLLGAATGMLLMTVGMSALNPSVRALATSYGSDYSLSLPGLSLWLLVLAGATALGVAGAAIAARTVRPA